MNSPGASVVKGGCLCGKVRYELRPPFLDFRYCHCSRCRKLTGSAHASNLFLPAEQLHWTAGEDLVARFDLPGAERFGRCFCRHCGAPVPRVSADRRRVVVPAGSLDDDPQVRPRSSIFWESRAPWYTDVEALPKHAEYPPENA